MKILLISGHGAGDPGASGHGYKEADLTIEMINGIAPILRKYATVDIYQIERNAYKDIQNNQLKVNFSNYDYVLEIHFNAGGGTGTEIYVTTKEKNTKVETAIMNELGTYYKVRGVNVKDFLVINSAKNKGVSSALLETCFIDSASDMKVYQENKQSIFNAVSQGVIKGFGLASAAAPKTSSNQFLYRAHVQDIGWTDFYANNTICGTTGQSKRIEALNIIPNGLEISAKVHIQDKGWTDFGIINKDTIIGTTGQSERLEALCLKGAFKYRIHIENSGWTTWTFADGINTLGSVGMSQRIEAIQISLL